MATVRREPPKEVFILELVVEFVHKVTGNTHVNKSYIIYDTLKAAKSTRTREINNSYGRKVTGFIYSSTLDWKPIPLDEEAVTEHALRSLNTLERVE